MTLRIVGEISEVNRYPVKSFAGESLACGDIETDGLYGDRRYAFVDETKEGWDSFITARQIPSMLAYTARLADERSADGLPQVHITAPDGRSMSWDDKLLNEIQQLSRVNISMMSYRKGQELLMVDAASILIVTDASLRKLEALWGQPLDPRRFRANLVISLEDGSVDEGSWIGKRLTVGEAQLQADCRCERCTMITIDPDTLKRDASLLRTVNEEMNLNFGVYASVVKTGRIHVGDKVYLKH